jgi:isoamylase
VLSKEQFYTDAEISWFNPQMGLPNWADPQEKQFACLIHENERTALYLMFNAGADAAVFGLPPVLPGARWHLAVDTSREAPRDLFAAGEEPLWEDPHTYHLSPRSSAILLARGTKDGGGNEAAHGTQARDPAQSIAERGRSGLMEKPIEEVTRGPL